MLVHELGEGRLVAGDMLRQGDAGVVAGLDDHALDQFLQGDLLADLGEHARAAGAPGRFADQDLVGEGDVTRGQFVEDHIGGQDLGQAGRVQAIIGTGLHQGLAAGVGHQQVALGREFRWGQGRTRVGHLRGSRRRGLWVGPWAPAPPPPGRARATAGAKATRRTSSEWFRWTMTTRGITRGAPQGAAILYLSAPGVHLSDARNRL